MTAIFASAVIGSDGTLISSQNISSCEHSGKGIYMVQYNSTFAAASGAQATIWGNGLTIGLNIMAENTCQVIIQDTNGTATDSGFSFFVPGVA